jgi:hypothetical protein
MSFGTRLASFFVLIVALPMVAVGFLVFRLTSDSAQGKAAARAAASRPRRQALHQPARRGTDRRRDDRSRRRLADWAGAASPPVGVFAAQAGLARVTLSVGPRLIADVDDRRALAPGVAIAERPGGGAPITVSVSAHGL